MRLGVLQVARETAILWNPLTALRPQTSEKAETPPPPRCVSSGMSQQRLESSPLPLECSFLTKGLRMFETLDHLEVTPQPLW